MPNTIELDRASLPPPGGMATVEADGQSILLIHDGESVHAIGATCPHAGGPLIEGIRHGDRIVCPWHKAAFCIRSGRLLDPPAVDALPAWRVEMAGTGTVRLVPVEAPEPPVTEDGRVFVIVGAGAAGAVAAQTLREEGFGGRVLLLDDANRVPYDRTLLSKYHLSGEDGAEKTPLQSAAFYDRHRIERRAATVVGLEQEARRLRCADGTVLDYDAVLLAPGSAAAPPSLPGGEQAGVFTLRHPGDADAILARADQARRVVILGASFIGMEAAAALRERGLEVTVAAREAAPFQQQLGPELGRGFVALHERHGVTFRLGHAFEAIEGTGTATGVRLEGGEVLPADLVIAGFGARPGAGFAEDLARKGVIAVDDRLRAAEAVFAAGDVARYPWRGTPIRVEHWRVAQQQGRAAALNMLGRDRPYDAVPYFWTIQYMKRLDYVGHAETWDALVVHGDPAEQDFLAYFVTDGRVTAAASMDRDRDAAALIELLSLPRAWTAEALGANPAQVLSRLG